MSQKTKRQVGTANTFVPTPTCDQGVDLGRAPQLTNDTTMLNLAANADSGFKVMDLTANYYAYSTLVISFSGLAADLAEFEGMFSDDSAGTTNPRPMNVKQTPFNPKIMTTQLAGCASFEVIPCARYFRYRCKNGATPQTAFRLHIVALDHRG